ncbi:MAG: FAD-binding protein, partial [Pseudomonadales bacterium]
MTGAVHNNQSTQLTQLAEAIRAAVGAGRPVAIKGGGTKPWLGRQAGRPAAVLDISPYQGVVEYRPEELMVRVKAGTRLAELNSLLAEAGQFLAFEPPLSGAHATVGGAVAAGLSGARRPYTGAVRDYILGAGLMGADGDYREFGGQVMKNVAGYDVSRLLVGSLGMLGVIVDVSFKLLP